MFYLDGIEFIDDINQSSNPIQYYPNVSLGDFMLVQWINKENEGFRYRYIALLKNLSTGVAHYYRTRFVYNDDTRNNLTVSRVLDVSEDNKSKKFKLEFEDGETFDVHINKARKNQKIRFVFAPNDIIKLTLVNTEDLYSHLNSYAIRTFRNGEEIPLRMTAYDLTKRTPFLERKNNQFTIQSIDEQRRVSFVDFIPYDSYFKLVSPESYQKSSKLTFQYVQDDIFVFNDEDGVEIFLERKQYFHFGRY